MRRTSILFFALLVSSSGCTGCLNKLIPDAGLGDLPDSGDPEFDALVGPPLDFDAGGDFQSGGLTFSITVAPPVKTMVVTSGDGSFWEQLTWPLGDNSLIVGDGDFNGDGANDWHYESFYDEPTKKVTSTSTNDTDFDGVPDSLDEWVVDVGQGLPYQKTETFYEYLWPDAGEDAGFASADAGVWVAVSSSSHVATVNMNVPVAETVQRSSASCILGWGAVSSRPDIDGYTGKWVPIPETKIEIMNDNAFPGACNDDQTKFLVADYKRALKHMSLCFAALNPDLWRAVKSAISQQTLFVACAGDCDGVIASTDLPYNSRGTAVAEDENAFVQTHGGQRMNLNSYEFFRHPPDAQEETLIHELLHFAGFDHFPPGSVNGLPAGHDYIYGCGRYCNGCQASAGPSTGGWGTGLSRPTAAMYTFDCVDCAEPSRTPVCGAGYVHSSSCNAASCQVDNRTNCSSCCQVYPLNCWADKAGGEISDLAWRTEHLELPLAKTGSCGQVCDGTDFTACCKDDPLLNVEACNNQTPCESFPAGPLCPN